MLYGPSAYGLGTQHDRCNHIFLGTQEAMSGQTELFKLGMIELALSPNPWTSPPRHYNQTLDLATGTLHIELGTYAFFIHFVHFL